MSAVVTGHDDNPGEVSRGNPAPREHPVQIEAQAQLAAIVEYSDDAIVSKSLDGIIQSWNAGARRIFGWTTEEAVGKPITLIIPPDRLDEEPQILARLRAGERVDHFETVRITKDGRRVHVSVTISPSATAWGGSSARLRSPGT